MSAHRTARYRTYLGIGQTGEMRKLACVRIHCQLSQNDKDFLALQLTDEWRGRRFDVVLTGTLRRPMQLTLQSESIITRTASQWKAALATGKGPDFQRKPSVFLLLGQ